MLDGTGHCHVLVAVRIGFRVKSGLLVEGRADDERVLYRQVGTQALETDALYPLLMVEVVASVMLRTFQ